MSPRGWSSDSIEPSESAAAYLERVSTRDSVPPLLEYHQNVHADHAAFPRCPFCAVILEERELSRIRRVESSSRRTMPANYSSALEDVEEEA